MVLIQPEEASDERRDDRDRRGNPSLDQTENDPAMDMEQRNPSRNVLQDIRPATTLQGKPRQRMRWSEDINRHLMLCYYQITNNETNLTEYRQAVHTAFTNQFPELNFISEQRLADQIRVIKKNKRLTEIELNNLKSQVRTLESTNTEEVETEIQENIVTVVSREQEEETETEQQQQEKDPEQKQIIEEMFAIKYAEYKDSNIQGRPYIHRLQEDFSTTEIIKVINAIISKHIDNTTTLEELQTIIYTGAATTCRLHSKQKEKNNNKTFKTPAWLHRLQKRIETLRKEIGQLTQYIECKIGKKKRRKMKEKTKEEAIEELDTKKQKLQALAQRLRRYKKVKKEENKIKYST